MLFVVKIVTIMILLLRKLGRTLCGLRFLSFQEFSCDVRPLSTSFLQLREGRREGEKRKGGREKEGERKRERERERVSRSPVYIYMNTYTRNESIFNLQ